MLFIFVDEIGFNFDNWLFVDNILPCLECSPWRLDEVHFSFILDIKFILKSKVIMYLNVCWKLVNLFQEFILIFKIVFHSLVVDLSKEIDEFDRIQSIAVDQLKHFTILLVVFRSLFSWFTQLKNVESCEFLVFTESLLFLEEQEELVIFRNGFKD